jgi:hypothetical protein
MRRMSRCAERACVNLPWLNRVDAAWLETIGECRTIIHLDNHYLPAAGRDAPRRSPGSASIRPRACESA